VSAAGDQGTGRGVPGVAQCSHMRHLGLMFRMNLVFLPGIVLLVEDVIPADEVDVGDVIVLPDADDPVVVNRVRLGQGGLIFTVTSASTDSPEQEWPVKLTTKVRLRKRGQETARWAGGS
jgi:hypothetical protein